ncbi:phage tail length tape measure family protein [Azospirillum argentinense]|uniref:phage tail length tape measure family protein n=1 Tax=Azospirillum argentinense TaxID=2970906 RepID=UPI00190E2E95|nr:phage tail length tape measure family protein [Azospirillum argentinense]
MAEKKVSVRLAVEADNLDAVRDKLKALGAEVTHVGNQRVDGLHRQLQALEARLDPAAKAAQSFARDAGTLKKALDAGALSQERYNALLQTSKDANDHAARSMTELQARARALQESIDPAGKAQRVFAESVANADELLAKGVITHEQHAIAVKKYHDTMRGVQPATDNAARSTKLAAHEVTNLSYQLQDFVVQVGSGQGIFTPLLQQAPQAVGAVGGVGRAISLLATPTTAAVLGIGSLALGFGLVLAKAVALQDEVRGFNVVLRATGNEAKTTAAEMQAAVTQMTRSGASRADALTMATAYLRNGRLNGAGSAAQLGTLATDLAAGMGTSTLDAFGKLDSWLSGGVSGLRQLATETKALSVAQYEAARRALEHGDRAKALQIVIDALKERFSGLHKDSLSPAAQAMKDLHTAYDNLMTKAAGAPITISVIVKTTSLMDEVSTFLETGAGPLRDRLIRNVIPGLELGQLTAKEFGGTVNYTPRLNNNPRRPGEGALTGAVYADDGATTSGAPIPGRKPTDRDGLPLDQALRISDAVKANNELAIAMAKVGVARAIHQAGQAAFDAEMEKSGNETAATALRVQAERKARLELSGAIADQTAQLTINTRESLKTADAYLQSAAAGERAKAMQQARLDSLTSGIDAETRYRQILAERGAQQAASGAAEVAATRDAVAARQRIADAALVGVEAQRKAELAETIRQATLAETIVLENAQGATADALRRIIEAKTQAVIADDAAQRRARAGGLLQGQREQIASLETERGLLFATAEQRAVGLARLQAELQLRREGIDVQGAEGRQFLANAESVARMGTEMDRLNGIGQTFDRAFDRVGDAVAQAFTQGSGAAVSFRSVVSGVLSSIAADLLKMSLINPFKNALLGGISGLFGMVGGSSFGAYTTSSTVVNQSTGRIVGGLHSGGLVGSEWTFQRSVDPSVFAGARRYHGGGLAGLAPNEVPAILLRDEEVLTADDPRHRFNIGEAANDVRGGGSVVIGDINVSVTANGGTPEQNADLADQIGRAMGDQLDARIVTVLRQQMRPGGVLRG